MIFVSSNPSIDTPDFQAKRSRFCYHYSRITEKIKCISLTFRGFRQENQAFFTNPQSEKWSGGA